MRQTQARNPHCSIRSLFPSKSSAHWLSCATATVSIRMFERIGFSKNSENIKPFVFFFFWNAAKMSLAALSRQLRHLSAHSRALQHQRHAASTNAGGGGGAAAVERGLKKVPTAMKPIQPQFWVAVQKTVRTSMLWGLGGPVLTIGLVDWLG